METITIQKFIHTSPRKLRLVADMVRKMGPVKALEALAFTPKAAASDLSLAIKTAVANAKQKSLQQDNLYFKSIEVNEGPRLKRMRAAAKGRARPYKKRMSHIKIVLTDDLSNKEKKENRNSEIEARTGQSGNEPKVKEGGRRGLSK